MFSVRNVENSERLLGHSSKVPLQLKTYLLGVENHWNTMENYSETSTFFLRHAWPTCLGVSVFTSSICPGTLVKRVRCSTIPEHSEELSKKKSRDRTWINLSFMTVMKALTHTFTKCSSGWSSKKAIISSQIFLEALSKWAPHWGSALCKISTFSSSWWLNQPLWKICSSKWESSPNRCENKTYLKPPTSHAST